MQNPPPGWHIPPVMRIFRGEEGPCTPLFHDDTKPFPPIVCQTVWNGPLKANPQVLDAPDSYAEKGMKKKLSLLGGGILVVIVACYFTFFRGNGHKYDFRYDKVSTGDISMVVDPTGTVNP